MGDTLELAISGELDLATRDLLRGVLDEVREGRPPRLAVDLRGRGFIEVNGFSLLMSFVNSCRGGAPVIEFVPARAHVHDASRLLD